MSKMNIFKDGDAYRLQRIAIFLFTKTCDEYDDEIEMLQRLYQIAVTNS